MVNKIYTYLNQVGFLIVGLFALYLLNPLNKGFLIGYVLPAFIFIKASLVKKNLDLDFTLLLLLSVIYGLFYILDPVDGMQFVLIYSLFPPTFYLLGKFMSNPIKDDHTVFYLLFFASALFSLPAVLSVYLNFAEGGFVQADRSIPYIWTGESLSATVMGAYLTLNMCIPALLIVGRKSIPLLIKIGMAILFILSLVCALRLGSRTQLSIFLLTSIIAVGYMLKRQTAKENAVLLFFLVVAVGLILNKVSFDLNADWLSSFASRMDGGRADVASGGGRTERWVKSFENMFTKPLGWDVNEFGYSHNLWLDVLRAGGIIPFLLLVIYSIRSFNQIRKIIKTNEHLFINGFILIYGLAFLLIFMVEPIFEGIFSLFVLFCFFKGVINKYSEIKSS
ncbi:hypothetical protein M3P19_16135 [Muricauda sp. 2012CJ35-5]|uniref:O-antigen ligase domain-containing protein n=1 Tax=Flagellimonas spongiicola TaxID=2942208 RepID=A0ABT0PW18_9FLAO|nr:hypothetical protein [Allomuricauda spongiicola]MCL6275545.1 hypothetical protein [Allomuricauda spongiicola]